MDNNTEEVFLQDDKMYDVIRNAFRSDGFLQVSKYLIKKIGMNEAILIADLFSREAYFDSKGMLDEGAFFCDQGEIEETTGFSPYEQRTAYGTLIDLGILEVTKRGMPARNYYRIVHNMMLNFLSASGEKFSHHSINKNKNNNDLVIKNHSVELPLEEEDPNPTTSEEYLVSLGYRKDSFVDSEGGMHRFWLDGDDNKLKPKQVSDLEKEFKRKHQVVSPRKPLDESFATTERLVGVIKASLESQYGNSPVIGKEVQAMLRQSLVRKYPKDFVKAYAQWYFIDSELEKEVRFKVQFFISEKMINQFLSETSFKL